jgi:hypothetical protein
MGAWWPTGHRHRSVARSAVPPVAVAAAASLIGALAAAFVLTRIRP